LITSQVSTCKHQEAKYYSSTLEDLANPEVGDAGFAHIRNIKSYRGSRGTAPLMLTL